MDRAFRGRTGVMNFRPEIAALPPYIPGKSSPDLIKVSSNEMPFPALPGVQAAVNAHVAGIGRYPDMSVSALREMIAALHKVDVDAIAVGNGSTDVLEVFLSAVCTPGSEVVYPWRSFEAYPIAVQIAGATSVQVPLAHDGNANLRAMLKAITERTRAVIVCTPNNPTSAALTHSALEAFLREVPPHIPVLLDEAYIDFVEMADPVRGIDLVRAFPNVVSLRTLSKAYGLAGLRVGYAVGQVEVATTLRSVLTPFGVNSLAQVAARAALSERGEVRRRVGIVTDERAKLVSALRSVGWSGPDPQANFVWIPTGDKTQRFVEVCRAEGIAVRGFGSEGTRVTVAESEASLRLVRAVAKFRSELDDIAT